MPSAAHGKQHNSEKEATAVVEAPILRKSVLGITLLEDVVCTECVRTGCYSDND